MISNSWIFFTSEKHVNKMWKNKQEKQKNIRKMVEGLKNVKQCKGNRKECIDVSRKIWKTFSSGFSAGHFDVIFFFLFLCVCSPLFLRATFSKSRGMERTYEAPSNEAPHMILGYRQGRLATYLQTNVSNLTFDVPPQGWGCFRCPG